MIRTFLLAAAFALFIAGSTLAPVRASETSGSETVVGDVVITETLLTNQNPTLDDSHENTANDDDNNRCNGC